MKTQRSGLLFLLVGSLGVAPSTAFTQQVVTGQAAFADYTQQKPGAVRKITVNDLPEPMPSEAVDNGPTLVERPHDAWPVAPAGFKVTLYAGGDNGLDQASNKKAVAGAATKGTFREPRLIRTAPNGDVFVSDSGAGVVFVLRGVRPDGRAKMGLAVCDGAGSSVWDRVLSGERP